MDNLEELDNKTLHAKCLEYGLPNIPITDTSRKLLIKRLQAAMDGSDKITEKQKNRRETMNVAKAKAPSEERSKEKSPSRRKTIDSTTAPSFTSGKSSPAPAQISQRRRSGRITPSTQVDSILSEPMKTKIRTTAIEEESDVVLIEDDESSSRPPSRQSRASSLSTSPIVTTTYTQYTNEPILEEYQEEREEPKYVQKSSYNYETRKTYVPTSFGGQRDSLYLPRSAQLSSRPTLIATAPTITSYESTTSSNVNRRHTNIGGSYDISSPSRTAAYHFTREDDDDDEIEKDAPYLSDFARKLSRLKTESVDGGLSALRKEVYQQKELPLRRSGRIESRLMKQESVGDSLKQLCIALNQKYGLKQKFYISGGILILIFLYVFFY